MAELDSKGIPYWLFQHKGAISSLEQADFERGQAPKQVVWTILFRLSADKFRLALIAGPQQIDWRKLPKFFDQSRPTMATLEEVIRITGYKPGAVSPFGLPALVPVIADLGVFEPEEILLGSGIRELTIIMTSADLKRSLPDVQILNISKA